MLWQDCCEAVPWNRIVPYIAVIACQPAAGSLPLHSRQLSQPANPGPKLARGVVQGQTKISTTQQTGGRHPPPASTIHREYQVMKQWMRIRSIVGISREKQSRTRGVIVQPLSLYPHLVPLPLSQLNTTGIPRPTHNSLSSSSFSVYWWFHDNVLVILYVVGVVVAGATGDNAGTENAAPQGANHYPGG